MSRPTMQDIIDLDEMLITRHLNPRAEGESLRSCIDRIINWEAVVNLDPAVSSAAQALVDSGKLQERIKWQKWRCRNEWDGVNDPPCHPSDKNWRPCIDCSGPEK